MTLAFLIVLGGLSFETAALGGAAVWDGGSSPNTRSSVGVRLGLTLESTDPGHRSNFRLILLELNRSILVLRFAAGLEVGPLESSGPFLELRPLDVSLLFFGTFPVPSYSFLVGVGVRL